MKTTLLISFLALVMTNNSWANRSEKLRKNIIKREIAKEKVKEKKQATPERL